MLVKFNCPAVIEMKINKERGLFRKKSVVYSEYIKLSLCNGICDESEVSEKIAKAVVQTTVEYEQAGYYEVKFCTDLNALQTAYPYDTKKHLEQCANLQPSIIPLNTLKMNEILSLLNATEFAQFCKENKIFFTDIS